MDPAPSPTVDPDESERRLTRLTERLNRFERTARRQRQLNAVLAAALAVAVSGWWLSSRELAATNRLTVVSDCRAAELAADLDEFRIIVAPGSDTAADEAAGDRLDAAGPLSDRYAACLTDPTRGEP